MLIVFSYMFYLLSFPFCCHTGKQINYVVLLWIHAGTITDDQQPGADLWPGLQPLSRSSKHNDRVKAQPNRSPSRSPYSRGHRCLPVARCRSPSRCAVCQNTSVVFPCSLCCSPHQRSLPRHNSVPAAVFCLPMSSPSRSLSLAQTLCCLPEHFRGVSLLAVLLSSPEIPAAPQLRPCCCLLSAHVLT
jgi:hypothetical protein